VDDEKILDLFFAREEEALEAVSSKYGAYCRAVAQGILRNHEDTLECVNDTYLRAWDAIPPARPGVLRIYLGKIARNLALDKYRKNTAAKRGGNTVTILHSELNDCIPGGNNIEAKEDAAHITTAIDSSLRKMPQEMRLVFMRRYWHADSIEASSTRINMSVAKVKSMLFRARQRLRTDLEGEGVAL
jgi:RNA polymerase sigma-70 factor (ECF subfamily)